MGIAHSELAAWPQQDIDLALAEVALEADTGRYGESIAEATNPAADPMEYGPYFYRAVGPHKNWAEAAVSDAEQAFEKNLPEGTRMPRGLFWTVEKVERPTVAGS